MHLHDINGCAKAFKKYIKYFILPTLSYKFYQWSFCEMLRVRTLFRCTLHFIFHYNI